MSIPTININFTGDLCGTCRNPVAIPAALGGCSCRSVLPFTPPTPNDSCSPGGPGVCTDAFFTDCTFYSAADIPEFGVKTNDILTSVIIKQFAQISALKGLVTSLQDSISNIQGNIYDIFNTLDNMGNTLSDLTARIVVLEAP